MGPIRMNWNLCLSFARLRPLTLMLEGSAAGEATAWYVPGPGV